MNIKIKIGSIIKKCIGIIFLYLQVYGRFLYFYIINLLYIKLKEVNECCCINFFFNLSRAEIESSMCVNEDDSSIVKQFKRTVLLNTKKRFPIHEIHVCGALLDPTLQNVTGVAEYLANSNSSPEEFLTYMIHKIVPLNNENKQVSLFLYLIPS